MKDNKIRVANINPAQNNLRQGKFKEKKVLTGTRKRIEVMSENLSEERVPKRGCLIK